MKKLLTFFAYCLLTSLLPGTAAWAQDLQPVVNRQFQVKYDVPADWHLTRHKTDSLRLTSYSSPDGSTRMWVGELRGKHRHLPPAQALAGLLRHLGATEHEEHNASAHGLDYLESTGTCELGGQELRYDARVTDHQGHVLLIYVYTTPDKFNVQEPFLHQLLDGVTPLQVRHRPNH